jgi:hypothetical protein
MKGRIISWDRITGSPLIRECVGIVTRQEVLQKRKILARNEMTHLKYPRS